MKPLTDDEIKEIYESVIRPAFFDDIKSTDKPEAIFLGGQPGSGKSKLSDISINDLHNKSALTLNTDDIRDYHPYKKLVPQDKVYELDREGYKWGNMLYEDCIKHKKNIIFDGTYGGDVAFQEDKMKDLKKNGYNIKLNLLATNDVVSKIGINYRYEKEKQSTGSGRAVDLSYHDKIYKNIPNNLMKTISKNLVDEFKIYGRNHHTSKVNLISEYKSHELKTNPHKPVVDFVKERTRQFTSSEINELHNWAKNTEKICVANKTDINAFRNSLTTDDTNASSSLKHQVDEIKPRDENNSKGLVL